jgi:hypothetical protein
VGEVRVIKPLATKKYQFCIETHNSRPSCINYLCTANRHNSLYATTNTLFSRRLGSKNDAILYIKLLFICTRASWAKDPTAFDRSSPSIAKIKSVSIDALFTAVFIPKSILT